VRFAEKVHAAGALRRRDEHFSLSALGRSQMTKLRSGCSAGAYKLAISRDTCHPIPTTLGPRRCTPQARPGPFPKKTIAQGPLVLAGGRCRRRRCSGLPVRPMRPAAAPRNASAMLRKDPIRAYSIISTISISNVHTTHLGK
jgi:hypothetical protein